MPPSVHVMALGAWIVLVVLTVAAEAPSVGQVVVVGYGMALAAIVRLVLPVERVPLMIVCPVGPTAIARPVAKRAIRGESHRLVVRVLGLSVVGLMTGVAIPARARSVVTGMAAEAGLVGMETLQRP